MANQASNRIHSTTDKCHPPKRQNLGFGNRVRAAHIAFESFNVAMFPPPERLLPFLQRDDDRLTMDKVKALIGNMLPASAEHSNPADAEPVLEYLFGPAQCPADVEERYPSFFEQVEVYNTNYSPQKDLSKFGREVLIEDLYPFIKPLMSKSRFAWSAEDANAFTQQMEGVVCVDALRDVRWSYSSIMEEWDRYLQEHPFFDFNAIRSL
ncbi:hypothetical protein BVRB_027360 [Beta vulgaris subsp. vulgaris]|uniref:Uncharacterized protein n=1 Tax=Beta vulgaris subsp. vulgaris TaxID=3555 RepID=A0A0J8B1T9_BETVV|nr:hypothetical protein BVRB_027360 [Beta vulgaris subsp. vulgaris]